MKRRVEYFVLYRILTIIALLEGVLAREDVWHLKKKELLTLDQVTGRHICNVLKITGGKVEGTGGAAELLGLNPGTLRHRMCKLGIPFAGV